MNALDRILDALAPHYRATPAPNTWNALCPVCGLGLLVVIEHDNHDDKPLSLWCWDGCAERDVLAALTQRPIRRAA